MSLVESAIESGDFVLEPADFTGCVRMFLL